MNPHVVNAINDRVRKLDKIGCAMIVTWFLMIIGIEFLGRQY